MLLWFAKHQNTKLYNILAVAKAIVLITSIIGAIFYVMPTPERLTLEGHHILVIVVIAIFLIIFKPIPPPAISFIVLIFVIFIAPIFPAIN